MDARIQNASSPFAPTDHVMSNTQDQAASDSAPSVAPTMSSNPLPVNLYENLLPKMVAVLQLTHQHEGTTTPAAKQAILQAVRTGNFSTTSLD